MQHRTLIFGICLSVFLITAAASAEDRLAVFETFGNPSGGYCAAAGPALKTLQAELEGRAVILEYDYYQFRDGRLFRFWATGVDAPYLPLVMVGSGYRTSSGPVDYYNEYAGMLAAELQRPPRVDLRAYWRRANSRVYIYVTVHNTSDSALKVDEQAAVWVILYSKESVGVSNTWVRYTKRWALEEDLPPGGTVSTRISTLSLNVPDWSVFEGVAMVEDRHLGIGAYDMAQAAELEDPSFVVTPEHLMVTPGTPEGEISLVGPHVLQWSATSDVPWLELLPASDSLPSALTVRLDNDLRPPGERFATVTIDAEGDSMQYSAEVEIAVGGRVRRPKLRLSPDGEAP